jgi:hypothetical protein
MSPKNSLTYVGVVCILLDTVLIMLLTLDLIIALMIYSLLLQTAQRFSEVLHLGSVRDCLLRAGAQLLHNTM